MQTQSMSATRARLKRCFRCGKIKDFLEFYKDTAKKLGVSSSCKDCTKSHVKQRRSTDGDHVRELQRASVARNPQSNQLRANNYYYKNHEECLAYRARRRKTHARQITSSKLKSTFGITIEQYEAMLVSQDFGCAVCGRKPGVGQRKLAVDHRHADGKVRGLLCSACNKAIGGFRESITVIKAAIEYLNQHESL